MRRGLVIGCFDGHTWDEQQLRIEPGDTIVLYTDGLIEPAAARPSSAKHSSTKPLRICVATPPHVLARTIAVSIRRIETKPRDDVAIIALRVR